MPRQFADLHLHPTLFTFNRVRNTPAESDPEKFNPWHIPASKVDDMAAGKRGSTYSQADVAKMTKGRLRIAFASITPIERGFFEFTQDDGQRDPSLGREFLNLISGRAALKAGRKLVSGEAPTNALAELTGLLRAKSPLRTFVQRFALKYSPARIRHMMSDAYDYWEEYEKEYAYWRAKDGEQVSTQIEMPHGTEHVTGAYHLVRDIDHYDAIQQTDSEIAFLMTIEGGHTFTMRSDGTRHSEDVIFRRITQLRTQAHPLFFITLAHHFDNGVCGHAHSIPDMAWAVMNQRPRMHEGFEREGDLGLRVARELYGLNGGEGRRILIDFKHLSAASRRELYTEVIEPHNRSLADGEEPIPVIFSHGAYSGRGTLEDVIRDADLESDHFHSGPFYAWNLNCCDEDAQMVHATKGLIGLVFEQRVCGVGPGQKVPPELYAAVIRDQIFGLVDSVVLDQSLSDDERIRMWDCICLGTDFDGMIDPFTPYPTAVELDNFARDLEAEFERFKHTRFIDEIGVEELVEKIAWKNADAFIRRLLPTL